MDVYDALDLSDGETKVYKALIQLKSSTTGPLYKNAEVSQSKVYEILDRLKKKGLVSSIIKNNITFWQPASPTIYLEKLTTDLEQLEERKNILEKNLPSLFNQATYPTDEAQVLIGYHGMRTALYSFLDTFREGEECVVFSAPKPIPEPFRAFIKLFNKQRVQKGVSARFVAGEKMRSFAEEIYDVPLTKIRYMQGLTPSSLAVGKDRIIIITYENKGKSVVITGQEIAHSYRVFFESLWNMAKE